MPATRSSLLNRVRNNDDAAGWREFDRLYRPLLTDYARIHGMRSQEAEEVAQECLAAISDVIHRFEKQKSFRGWLQGMVRRKVADQIKANQKHTRADTTMLATTPDKGTTAEQAWTRIWNRTHLEYCLELLREEFAQHTLQAFHYYVLEELPVDLISEKLGMTPNQIYVAKNRVMKKLRSRCSDLLDGLY
ncbi:MAG: RNA polymerase sigma factor [Planctomycetota bacterium]|jgi:RNA polymerase sigma factor (sigma-70 family)